MFSTLSKAESRWKSVACGYASQFVFAAVLLAVSVTAPKVVQHRHEVIGLVPSYSQVQPKEHKIAPILSQSKPLRIQIPQQELQVPPLVKEEIKRVALPITPANPVLSHSVQIDRFTAANTTRKQEVSNPRPQVLESAGFASQAASSVAATQARVHTGAFGDPNGLPASSRGSGNAAVVGSFGGSVQQASANPRRIGEVASAGFGSGASASRSRQGEVGQLKVASFAAVTNPAPAVRRNTSESQPVTVPVQVQFKPSPVYSAEARQLRVEGEVVVEVVFPAVGSVKVVKVLHRLGHGLDEAAIAAAQAIRFTPAQQNGKAVDSVATLHIVFQLS